MSDDWQERWDRGARTFYLIELVRQATYAFTALDQALQVAKEQNGSEVWPPVQTFLTAAANVSKLLWPIRTDGNNDKARWRRFRGEQLRAELGIDEASALHSRVVRDSADHFDERLDDLARDQEIPETFAAARNENFVRLPAPFRAIDAERGVIVAGHDEMEFVPVVAELKALLERCAEIRPGLIDQSDLVAMLTTLRWPPLPSIFAPSERPDEPVPAGAEVDRSGPQTLEELVALVTAKYREERDQGDQSIRDTGK